MRLGIQARAKMKLLISFRLLTSMRTLGRRYAAINTPDQMYQRYVEDKLSRLKLSQNGCPRMLHPDSFQLSFFERFPASCPCVCDCSWKPDSKEGNRRSGFLEGQNASSCRTDEFVVAVDWSFQAINTHQPKNLKISL